jgi:two-component system sensor histidine kinase KdpD
MTDHLRPIPGDLLAAIQRTEAKQGRGKLKIFFGMAPGVGKTYAMLQAAQEELAEGRDVVIGLVVTHGRADTEKLIGNLPRLPLKKIDYRGVHIEEFDLEGALTRKPALILVDELPHTNAPGSRHTKRFQDIEELLAAGIDVFTALNVQHLESRSETVRQITGATVHETVPDSVIESADAIQLVDLTPEQLRERLAEGKVYLGDRAGVAADNFFKETNLTALRQLALRLTAERVDQQLRDIRAESGTRSIWRSGDRLLVAVSGSPFSTKLVRWTRRMAYALDAPWVAVAVDTGEPIDTDSKKRLEENLDLARQLGAEIVQIPGTEVADALLRVAHQHNVTQIVVGKPQGNPLYDLLTGGSLVDKLIRRSGQIDVYVVPAERRTRVSRWREWIPSVRSRPREYFYALAMVSIVTLAGWPLAKHTGYFSVSLLYLAGVVILGLFSGMGPILAAAALSALAWNFLFIEPLFTFRVGQTQDMLMIGMLFGTALITGRLAGKLREQARSESLREQRSGALYRLTQAIADADNEIELVRNSAVCVSDLFGAKLAVFATDEAGGLRRLRESTFHLDERELVVADWTYRNRRVAGRFTDTIPASEGFYLPILSGDRCVGVMGVSAPADSELSVVQRILFESFAGQLGPALERESLRAAGERARMTAESERLQRSLLDSVSHELKTPLAVISGAAEQLTPETPPATAALLRDEIVDASRRLRRLVNNLLDMTRLESGVVRPVPDWCDPNDIVHAAIEATAELRKSHPTRVTLPEALPLVRVDHGLVSQALINLLHNAAAHTPAGTEIFLEAGVDAVKGVFRIEVYDTGPGLPEGFSEKAFSRFERGVPERAGGLGLGLSIVKGFVEAHGGTVTVSNRPEGGARFLLEFPWKAHGEVPVE